MKKHLFALSCSLVLGACASIPTSLYPGLVDEGGRFMQLITKHNGVVTIEFETPSNSECLSLAKTTDSKPNQVIKKCAVDSALNLKGYGILENKILDRKMPMRFLTKDACIALSNEYKNNPNRPLSESIECQDYIVTPKNTKASEKSFLYIKAPVSRHGVIHVISFPTESRCKYFKDNFLKITSTKNRPKGFNLDCQDGGDDAKHNFTNIYLNHKGKINIPQNNEFLDLYSMDRNSCNASWGSISNSINGYSVDCQ